MAGHKRVEDARERAYARPSTSLMLHRFEDVDARDKRGHDERGCSEMREACTRMSLRSIRATATAVLGLTYALLS
jgi:hypothetical protein